MDLLKNFFKGDKAIWIIYLFLCLISIVEVFSASSTLTYKSGDHWGPITNHLTLLMVGTIAVWIVHNIPCRWFKTFIALLPISWGLLIAVFVIGALTNGAKRWIDLVTVSPTFTSSYPIARKKALPAAISCIFSGYFPSFNSYSLL